MKGNQFSTELYYQIIAEVQENNERMAQWLETTPEIVSWKGGSLEETLLHFFAVENEPYCVSLLSQHGALLNVENTCGNTPLMDAGILKNISMCELLLNLGADVNHVSTQHEMTAFYLLVTFQLFDVAAFLVDKGADLNVEDRSGYTILMDRASIGDKEAIKFLISINVNVNYQSSKDHSTALHHATFHEDFDIAQLLIDHGASVDARNIYGRKPPMP